MQNVGAVNAREYLLSGSELFDTREAGTFYILGNYKIYTKCQQKAFITGSFTFVSGFAGLYLAQEFLKDYLPYKRTSFFLPPVILGSIASYLVTRWKTKECQAMWMALEEKHTALTSLEEKKDQ